MIEKLLEMSVLEAWFVELTYFGVIVIAIVTWLIYVVYLSKDDD